MTKMNIPNLRSDHSPDFIQYSKRLVFEEGVIVISGASSEFLGKFQTHFGDIVPQHDGNVTFDVKPSDELGKIYHSRTSDAVPAHTDGHNMKVPPGFFLLLCLQPSSKQDGLTEVSHVRDIIRGMSDEEIEILESEKFEFSTKPSTFVMNQGATFATIYDREKDLFRYSYNYLSGRTVNKRAADLVSKIQALHDKNKTSILMKSGDLLICDNHRVLHSRTSFSSGERHLVRAWSN